MAQIQAWQHIYSNVEKEQSPHKRGGFQTLFYTRDGLTQTEVSEMEAYLLYFPSEIEPVKKVFFSTSTGKMVVGHIVPLPAPDQAGRGGRYLAHSLIFTPTEFTRLNLNPFRVFRHFPFITTVTEALERGDFQTGNIPVVSFDFPEEPPLDREAAGHWSSEELKNLAWLALNADRMARERSTVAFVGEPQEIESAVEAAFFSVPLMLRSGCSFDTYFYRCNLVATYYWGIGLSKTTNPKLIVVDTQSKQVKKSLDTADQTAYARWVMAAIDTNNLAHITEHKESAFALSELLHGRPGDISLLDGASPEAVRSVFQANEQQVQERFRLKLSEQLPSILVDRIFERFYDQHNPAEILERLRHGFDISRLLEVLLDAYTARDFRAPKRKERKALGRLLQQNDHQDLDLLLAYWSGRKELRRALAQLNEEAYRQFVRKAFQFQRAHRLTLLIPGAVREALHCEIATPLALFVPGKGSSFVEVYLGTYTPQERDWAGLVEALSEAEEAHCLSQLAPYIRGLKAKELRALEKIVQKEFDLPEPFRQAVLEAIAALPQEQGLKGVFRKLFG